MSGQDVIAEAVGRLFRVQRSLNAKIEVATKSRSGYDRMQERTPVETARTFIEQGTIVKVPPLAEIKYTIPLDAPNVQT